MRREEMADLTAFLAVAEERSFTRAAARLGMSQSALSQIVRRLEAMGLIDSRVAERSVRLALDLPIVRARHRALVTGAWGLRRNLSIYDAMYLSLAERLDCALLTRDRRLGRMTGSSVPVILLPQ
jgi:predicted nucleic acid-binding protein